MKSIDDSICVVCGNECKFQSISNGYANTCSYKCAQLNPDTRRKVETTNLTKYGSKTPSGNKHIQDKITATNMKRYGTKTPYQNKYIKAKGIETTINKYGVDNVFKLDDIKAKSRKTMKTKYGHELNLLRPEVKEHIKLSRRINKFPEFITRLKLKHITYLDTEDIYVNQNVDRNYKCNLCGKHFTESSTQAYDVQCGCLRRRSKGEHEIHNWLTSLHFNSTQTEYIYIYIYIRYRRSNGD